MFFSIKFSEVKHRLPSTSLTCVLLIIGRIAHTSGAPYSTTSRQYLAHQTQHPLTARAVLLHTSAGEMCAVINQSINQYKFLSEKNITENFKIFLQLYMIMTDLLICHQDLVMGGCYYTLLT